MGFIWKLTKLTIVLIFVGLFVVLWLGVTIFNHYKPFPEGTNFVGDEYFIDGADVKFLYDLTYFDGNVSRHDLSLFDAIYDVVDSAEEFVLIDMFLVSVLDRENGEIARLLELLVEKKRDNPDMPIYFITDEINTNYGGRGPYWIGLLEDEGISVVFSDVSMMRDPTPFYTGFWRIFVQWFGVEGNGWISVRGDKITLRSFLKGLNAKFNHRKVVIGDDRVILSSGNLRELKRPYSDTGVIVKGEIWKDVFESERVVAELSGVSIEMPEFEGVNERGNVSVRLLTEGKIGDWLVNDIDLLAEGDNVDIAMFLLSDEGVIDSLVRASKRGVEVRLVLDPSKSLFGIRKFGFPNEVAARNLVADSNGEINVKFYETGEEKFHTKLVSIKKGGMRAVYVGSANLVKRSIGIATHLESEFRIEGEENGNFFLEVNEYFNRLWNNDGGDYTITYQS